ncbi:MAG: copper amine oxidase N-terminal domain-containing protein [Lachnospirales bacterium]
MKKFIFGVTLGCTVMLATQIFAEGLEQRWVIMNGMNLAINGKQIEGDNIMYEDTTYAPLREIAKLLGAEIVYNENNNTANLVTNSEQNTSTSNADIVVNGKSIDGGSINVDGVVYAPLREVAELMNGEVTYDNETKSIKVESSITEVKEQVKEEKKTKENKKIEKVVETPKSDIPLENEIFNLINDKRISKDLEPYTWTSSLSKKGREYSKVVSLEGTEKLPIEFINYDMYNFSLIAGNIYSFSKDTKTYTMFEEMLKENDFLGSYTDVGIGVFEGDNNVYITIYEMK